MISVNLAKPKVTKDPKFLAEIRKLPCVVCGKAPPSTVSHIKTRGSGGGDDWFNCVPKCFRCHRDWESRSALEFCDRHPHFKTYLEFLGWYFDGYKLRHPELEKA